MHIPALADIHMCISVTSIYFFPHQIACILYSVGLFQNKRKSWKVTAAWGREIGHQWTCPGSAVHHSGLCVVCFVCFVRYVLLVLCVFMCVCVSDVCCMCFVCCVCVWCVVFLHVVCLCVFCIFVCLCVVCSLCVFCIVYDVFGLCVWRIAKLCKFL